MITVAIDPGEHKSAAAIFDGTELVGLEWLFPGFESAHADKADRTVIEKPRLYPGHPRPANILNLAWGGALVAAAFRPQRVIYNPESRCGVKIPRAVARALIVYEPSQWKGNVKKPAHHMRCWRKLDAHERMLFEPCTEEKIKTAVNKLARTGKVTGYSFETHNLLDACALGMYHLKRTPKGG